MLIGAFPGRTRIKTGAQRLLKVAYAALIEPIAHLLPTDGEENVVLIPTYELFTIPFATLLDGDGRSLGDRHTIHHAVSIQTHIQLNRTKTRQGCDGASCPAMVVGNPLMPPSRPSEKGSNLSQLQYAEKEALESASHMASSRLTGPRTTKSEILRRMVDARVVHIATHGLQITSNGEDLAGMIVLSASDGGRWPTDLRGTGKSAAPLAIW